MTTEVIRAFRFTLAPTAAQEQKLLRWCGNARLAYNYAIAEKRKAHEQWQAEVQALVDTGLDKMEARKRVKVPTPRKPTIQKRFIAERGDAKKDVEGICPWYDEVASHVFQSGFLDADAAWTNWVDSYRGVRKGRRVGYPRFKKRGVAKDAFRLYHSVESPTIRFATYRRLRLPKFGEVRLHDSARTLGRMISRGEAVVQSVSVSRSGHRWYASVLCKVQMRLPKQPTRAQQEGGTVGVDLGVRVLAALSKPLDRARPDSLLIPNPRHLAKASARLRRAQQTLSRRQPGSARREEARRRVARLHHEVAVRRQSSLHLLTKRLATGFEVVAVEDLDLVEMAARKRSKSSKAQALPASRRASHRRSVLDAAMGETRRQLTYKTSWYGSRMAVLDRWWPSSKTCSSCGWQNPSLTLNQRVFSCTQCGLKMDRDINAARNIEAHASVASGAGETQNARGEPVRLPRSVVGEHGSVKREDTGPPGLVPPRRSDPPASPRSRQEQAKSL